MPGQTNSTTILAADNQLIITQNEQTTELNDIEEAILSLKAVIASTGSGGGGVVGTGDGPTGIQDMIGVDPLEDFTPEQGNNRCTIANFVFDGIYQCADELGDGPLQGLTTLAAAITTGIPSFVLGVTVFASSPVILVAAGSVLLGAIAAYIAYNGDFSAIAEELAEQKQAIINDLYTSKDVYEAKAAFADNCSGLSNPNQILLGLLCHTDILKVLFISNFAVPAGYSPENPCSDEFACLSNSPENPIFYDLITGVGICNQGNCTLKAVHAVTDYRIDIEFSTGKNITIIDIPAGTYVTDSFIIVSQTDVELYKSGIPPANNTTFTNVKRMALGAVTTLEACHTVIVRLENYD